MPKIPEFTRSVFASQQQPGRIGAIQGQFNAAAQTAAIISQVSLNNQKQRDVEQTANFNNLAQQSVAESQIALQQDPEVQKNPQLFKEKISNVFQTIKNDPSYVSLSSNAKEAADIRLESLNTNVNIKALDYEVRQNASNAINTVREGQDINNLAALTTDDPIETIAEIQANSIRGFVSSGSINVNDGEELLDDSIRSIYTQRAQKLINEDNLEEARIFADENKEELGVNGFQKVQDTIKSKEKLKKDQAVKLEKTRLSDPWTYINQIDKEEIPSIRFDDVGSVSDDLDDRISFINQKNKQYGTNLPILTELETQAFTQALENQDPKESANLLHNIATNITDEQQSLLAESIFEDKPSLGVAISIADEDPQTSSSIIAGNRAMKNKIVTMPSESNMRNEFLNEVGKAIQQPQFREASLNAVRAIYANKAVENNINDTTVDPDLLDKSILEVFGETIDINDSQVIGFRKKDGRFIPEDDFQDLFENLDKKQIASAHSGDLPRVANGDELDLDDIKEADLVVVGDGLYTINLFNEFAVDKNGNPFVLNLKKIHNK